MSIFPAQTNRIVAESLAAKQISLFSPILLAQGAHNAVVSNRDSRHNVFSGFNGFRLSTRVGETTR